MGATPGAWAGGAGSGRRGAAGAPPLPALPVERQDARRKSAESEGETGREEVEVLGRPRPRGLGGAGSMQRGALKIAMQKTTRKKSNFFAYAKRQNFAKKKAKN